MMNSNSTVQECDATDDASSTAGGKIKKQLYQFVHFAGKG